MLDGLPGDLDYVFHLATYHGNQSSMANPLADHENNTLTTLKLYERIKDLDLRKVVYASAGCTVAEKTFDHAEATSEDAPVSLYLDSPYQISKIVGEYYSNYYLAATGSPWSRLGSRTSTGRVRCSAPGAGAGPSTRCGGTSRRRSSTRRCRASPCPSKTAASRVAT